MEKSIQAEGETVQEAVDAALDELGVGPDEVDVEVLEEANKGLLGLRKGRAKVLVTVKDYETVALDVVEEFVRTLAVPAVVKSHYEDDELWVTITGESLAWLIGHHGQTLDALQVVVGAIVNKRMKSQVRAIFDVEGYRHHRKQEIQALAEKTIGKVLDEQEPVSLRPMSALERKIVHLTVGRHEGVASSSDGYGPERHVIISPAQKTP